MYEFLDWTVQDVMNRPICIAPDATLADAEKLLEEHGFQPLHYTISQRYRVGMEIIARRVG